MENPKKVLPLQGKSLMMNPQYQQISDENTSVVNEALQGYARTIAPTPMSPPKPTAMNNTNFFNNKMLIIRTIRHGLPFSIFQKIKNSAPFTDEDWARYLNVSSKTLQRHRKEAQYHFKPIHTEKIIELAEVTQLGVEVFDSQDQFYSWLHTPSYALGQYKPAELLKDSYGKELVMAELYRIDQGIFA